MWLSVGTGVRMEVKTFDYASPSTPKTRDSSRSRAQMDALRFGAIALIMFHHFYHVQRPIGTVGTHFFFALTGFLVANSLMKLREQVLAGETSPLHAGATFILRRWMRVLPTMWIMLAMCFVLNMTFIRETIQWHALLLSNLYISATAHYPPYVAHLWWISAMEQTLPIFILLFMFTPKHRMQLVLACVILIGPIFRFIAYWQRWDYISTRVLPPAFIDIVGMGCLLAVAMKHKNERLIQTLRYMGWIVGVPAMLLAIVMIHYTHNDIWKNFVFDFGSTWAACAAIIATYRGIERKADRTYTGWAPLAAIRTLCFQCYNNVRSFIGNLLATRASNFLGGISYGMAMWHLFAMAVMQKVFKGAHPHWRSSGSFAIAFVLAMFTYYLVERPISRIRESGKAPKLSPVPKVVLPLKDAIAMSDMEDVELAK